MSENDNKNVYLNFDKINIPQPYQPINIANSDKNYITYGYDNLYPNWLLNLYSKSSTHAACINGKATYIIGDGFSINNEDVSNTKVNATETIYQLGRKAVLDFLIYNYFCIEVCYNIAGEPISYHFVPGHSIRANKSKNKFWYNENWFMSNGKANTFDGWTSAVQMNPDETINSSSKLFFYEGYFPSAYTVYPKPEYESSIINIATDAAIADFNLNNIRNDFSVSTLITFFKGQNISDDIKRQVVKDVKQTYTGETGKKFIIDFQDENSKPAEVNQLSPNNWSEAYEVLQQCVQDDIYVGHSVTSPMLFSGKTAGQLGGATELETAYEIFKNNYIRDKRNEILTGLNLLFSNSPLFNGKLDFIDRPLFTTIVSESLKEKIYTVNELRKINGLPSIASGDIIVSQLKPVATPSNEGQVLSTERFSDDYVSLTETHFQMVRHLGLSKTAFETLAKPEMVFSKMDADSLEMKFDEQSDIAEYVISNDIKGVTVDELKSMIRKSLNILVTKSELIKTLDSLKESGIIDWTKDANDKIKVSPSSKESIPNTRKVEVRYSYEVRPGVGAPIIDATRSFCRSLIENDKYYTRTEIQEMSAIFGYDVFAYTGGFYHNPRNQETTNYCRHRWVGNRVIRKS